MCVEGDRSTSMAALLALNYNLQQNFLVRLNQLFAFKFITCENIDSFVPGRRIVHIDPVVLAEVWIDSKSQQTIFSFRLAAILEFIFCTDWNFCDDLCFTN